MNAIHPDRAIRMQDTIRNQSVIDNVQGRVLGCERKENPAQAPCSAYTRPPAGQLGEVFLTPLRKVRIQKYRLQAVEDHGASLMIATRAAAVAGAERQATCGGGWARRRSYFQEALQRQSR